MAEITVDLKAGVLLKDHKSGRERTIKLVTRIDPMGTDIPAYWQVENTDTGLQTTIREDRFAEHRWEQVS